MLDFELLFVIPVICYSDMESKFDWKYKWLNMILENIRWYYLMQLTRTGNQHVFLNKQYQQAELLHYSEMCFSLLLVVQLPFSTCLLLI